jgi:hypothetical protein
VKQRTRRLHARVGKRTQAVLDCLQVEGRDERQQFRCQPECDQTQRQHRTRMQSLPARALAAAHHRAGDDPDRDAREVPEHVGQRCAALGRIDLGDLQRQGKRQAQAADHGDA